MPLITRLVAGLLALACVPAAAASLAPYTPPASISLATPPTAATDGTAGCVPGVVANTPTALYQAVSCAPGGAVWNRLLAKPVKPQIIATRGRMPYALEGAGSNNYTRFESQLTVYNGQRPAVDVRVCYVNAEVSTAGEVYSGGASYALQAAIYLNSTLMPLSFGGPLSPTLDPGGGVICSEPAGGIVAAGQALQIRSGAIVASGQQAFVAMPSTYGYSGVDSTSASSQVYGTGALTTPSGGAVAANGFTPAAVVGTPDQNYPSVCIWGDSIEWGYYDQVNDAASQGAYGFAERGLLNVGGYNVPYINMSRVGDRTAAYNTGYSWRRRALLKYCSHVIANMGTNDLGVAATDAQLTIMKANVTALATYVHQIGGKLIYCTMTPKTTSTDAWATLANQTTVAGYESSGYVAGGTVGLRGAWNGWLAAQVAAGVIDGLIDTDAAVRDPTYPDKWRVTGSANGYTNDGLHPQPAAIPSMAAAVNARAATFTVQ